MRPGLRYGTGYTHPSRHGDGSLPRHTGPACPRIAWRPLRFDSDVEAKQELRAPLDCRENVSIATAFAATLEERCLFLHANERPNFVALDIGRLDVLHRAGQEIVGLLPGLDHDPQDRVFVQSRQPGRCPNARALQEQIQGERSGLQIGSEAREGFRLRERLVAFQAPVALLAVACLSELLGRLSACWAVHRVCLISGADRGRMQLSRLAFRRFAWVTVAPSVLQALTGFSFPALLYAQNTPYGSKNSG